MVKTRKFVYAKQFDGMPKESDFKLVEEDLPELEDGEFLCEAMFVSVDPYMRAFSNGYRIGMTMIGTQIARVIQSKTLQFPVTSYVLGNFGWQTHTICSPETFGQGMFPSYILAEIPGHPLSLYLGILGMPGNTAYFGFKECCSPLPGETVVISGAAGAVGSHVGQIAKTMGCTVYGITGSDEKGEWIKSIGFDGYINYKTCGNLNIALSELAPHGIDCFFDNVGGELSSQIIQHMNVHGRIACCGTISAYNESSQSIPKATIIQPSIIMKLLTIRGLQSTTYKNCWMEGIRRNTELLQNGQLKYRETITSGFENLPGAFIQLFSGENIGKAVVKV